MISALKLANLKCFSELNLSLRALTVLSGFNAAGKSTAVQGLLLITQALRSDPFSSDVSLNGCCVELGTPGDVLKDGGRAGRDITIGFVAHDMSLTWHLEADDRSRGLALRTTQILAAGSEGSEHSYSSLGAVLDASRAAEMESSLAMLQQLISISAIRPALGDVFPSPQEAQPIHANVGMNGQYAPWWFNQMSDEEIDANRCHPSDKANFLRRQFAAWAGTMFPGAQANVQHLARTAFSRLELRTGDTDDWRRPANIGYGLSYAFPILVAGLLARRGQLLIIDSPEAHLHPAAQSAMGQFLAVVANSGTQVIVETHSDHVINGMRLAVRNGVANDDQLIFHFFSRRGENPSASAVETISVDSTGRMSAWPGGFFDQIEKDLALL